MVTNLWDLTHHQGSADHWLAIFVLKDYSIPGYVLPNFFKWKGFKGITICLSHTGCWIALVYGSIPFLCQGSEETWATEWMELRKGFGSSAWKQKQPKELPRTIKLGVGIWNTSTWLAEHGKILNLF